VVRGERHGARTPGAFASRFGADEVTAALWPLIVDGLPTTATVELWKTGHDQRSGRWSAWLAFLFGVALSLCANIAAAPELSVIAVAVAACPPLALLLAVEFLNGALKRHRAETASEIDNETHERSRLATRTHRQCVSRWSRPSLTGNRSRPPNRRCGRTIRPSAPTAARHRRGVGPDRRHQQLRSASPTRWRKDGQIPDAARRPAGGTSGGCVMNAGRPADEWALTLGTHRDSPYALQRPEFTALRIINHHIDQRRAQARLPPAARNARQTAKTRRPRFASYGAVG
jgi:hypothetical protein